MTQSGKNLSLFPGAARNSRFNQRTAARAAADGSSQPRASQAQVSQTAAKAATSRLWLAVCLYDLIAEAAALAAYIAS